MKNFVLALLFGIALTCVMTIEASAQCANGNCSSANATLGNVQTTLPAPVFAPAPAPQIAYYTAPAGSAASASASTSVATAPQMTGQLVVAGYTAPAPQMHQVAYYTVPAQQNGGSAASASADGAAASTSASTAPSLIGASTNLACQNGGCSGSRFAPFKNIRARRSGNFAKSVSISRS